MVSPRVALIPAYERILDGWELDLGQGAKLLGQAEATLQNWLEDKDAASIPTEVLERLSHLIRIWEELAAVFGNGELARSWVQRPNTDFGEQPPLETLLRGDVQAFNFVRAYLAKSSEKTNLMPMKRKAFAVDMRFCRGVRAGRKTDSVLIAFL